MRPASGFSRAAWADGAGRGQGASRRPHGPAGLLALGMTALLLALLNRPPPSAPRALPPPAGLVLALLPPPAVPAAPAQRLREPRKTPAAPTVPGMLQAVPALPAVTPRPPSAPVSWPEETSTAHGPQEPASAPLRLDTQVLRRAARDSAGIARAAQAATGERAGRPDCIGPNAQGSLLSLPKLALDAVTGKCK